MKKLRHTDPGIAEADRPCCAHTRVQLVPVEHVGGTKSDRWLCMSCLREFAPVVSPRPAQEHDSTRADSTPPAFDEHDVAPVIARDDSGDEDGP